MIGSCESNRYPDYTFGEAEEISTENAYDNTVYEVDQLLTNKMSDYDYDGWLDYSEVSQNQETVIDNMVYLPTEDETYTQLLAMKLGLDSALMDAPSFEEIAGCVSLYSGEPIIDYGTYLQFLVDVANSQTISVLYG